MSADNWAICPQCKKDEAARKQELIEKLYQSYGNVTEEDYLELKEKSERGSELRETLREDYETFMDSDGLFFVGYSCSCDVCNFNYGYEFRKQVLE